MHFEQLTLLVTQHLAFLVITLYLDPFYLLEHWKRASKNNSCHLLKIFFLKERYKIPYIVLQIIIIFLENDFTFKVPQIVTHGLVLFLFLSKRLHHFWWGHLFQSWNYFILHETIWGTKGFPVYWKERLKLNIHKLTFFLSEEIPFLK